MSSIPTRGNFIFYWNFLRDIDANFVQKYEKYPICVIYEQLEWCIIWKGMAYILHNNTSD